MSKQEKKLAKKKHRERAIQAKLRLRRVAGRDKAKAERQELVEQDAYKKLIKERIHLEAWAKTVEGKIPEELHDRIINNIAILKALEAEHAAEQKIKQAARMAGLEQGNLESLEVGCAADSEQNAQMLQLVDDTSDKSYNTVV